jgi:hypothetical protein
VARGRVESVIAIAALAAAVPLLAKVPGAQNAVRYVPANLTDTAWLAKLKAAQVKAMTTVGAFHDFQFTDRVADSGITFKHHIVDDAGRTYKAAHYDHGNGLAVPGQRRQVHDRHRRRRRLQVFRRV